MNLQTTMRAGCIVRRAVQKVFSYGTEWHLFSTLWTFCMAKVLKERLFLFFSIKKILKYRQYTNRESSNSNAAIAIMLATEVHVVSEICAINPSITKIATINHHLGLLLLNGLKKSLIRIFFMLVIKSCAKIQLFLR